MFFPMGRPSLERQCGRVDVMRSSSSPGPDDSSLVNRVDLDSQAVTFVFQHELPIQHLVVNDDAEVFEFSSIDSGEFASADDTTYLTVHRRDR